MLSITLIFAIILLLQSTFVWLILNRLFKFGERCSFGRVLLAVALMQVLQYPIGHWHLLDSIGYWIFLQHFALIFVTVYIVFRFTFWRSLAAAVVCHIVTTAVLLLYGAVFHYIGT